MSCFNYCRRIFKPVGSYSLDGTVATMRILGDVIFEDALEFVLELFFLWNHGPKIMLRIL